VVYPVCDACSQRKVGTTLQLAHGGLAASKDWIAEGATPQALAEAPVAPAGARCDLALGELTEWAQLRGAPFRIRVSDLPKAAGTFAILQGEPAKPVLSAFLKESDQGLRRLLLCPPVQPVTAVGAAVAAATAVQASSGAALASIAPGGSGREPCATLELRVADGNAWGALVSKGDGLYTLFREKKLTLTLQYDCENSRLCALAGDEPVGVASPSESSDFFEVGVRPDVDPLLLLSCVLGVMTFELGPAVLPEPVM